MAAFVERCHRQRRGERLGIAARVDDDAVRLGDACAREIGGGGQAARADVAIGGVVAWQLRLGDQHDVARAVCGEFGEHARRARGVVADQDDVPRHAAIVPQAQPPPPPALRQPRKGARDRGGEQRDRAGHHPEGCDQPPGIALGRQVAVADRRCGRRVPVEKGDRRREIRLPRRAQQRPARGHVRDQQRQEHARMQLAGGQIQPAQHRRQPESSCPRHVPARRFRSDHGHRDPPCCKCCGGVLGVSSE